MLVSFLRELRDRAGTHGGLLGADLELLDVVGGLAERLQLAVGREFGSVTSRTGGPADALTR